MEGDKNKHQVVQTVEYIMRFTLPGERPIGVCGGRRRSAPAWQTQPGDDFQSDWSPSPGVIWNTQKSNVSYTLHY